MTCWNHLLFSVALLTLAASPLTAEESVLARLGAADWHRQKIQGQGITVAVLDNGFRGYRDLLGKSLPATVIARSFRADENLEAKDSIHGLLCAEVVHTIAPKAKIVFANWEPDQPASFLKAVAWCREQGVTIFTCSLVMPGWSDGHGGGEVHQKLAKDLDGALFFASAGNLARRHWNGQFRGDERGLHQWQSGRTENMIRPWGGQPVSVEVTAANSSTYKISLIDSKNKLVGREQTLSAGGITGTAVRFLPDDGVAYRLRLERLTGSGGDIRLVVLGARLDLTTDDGCMVFPGDGANAIAVGAVTTRDLLVPESSKGTVEPRVKPECVAITPFPIKMRTTPFSGTSAAAPQAAGLAALMWSGDRSQKATVVRHRILESCIDLGATGPDVDTGYGRIQLPLP